MNKIQEEARKRARYEKFDDFRDSFFGKNDVPFIEQEVADTLNQSLAPELEAIQLASFKAHLINYFLGLGLLENHKRRNIIITAAVNQLRLYKSGSKAKIKVEGKEFIIIFKGNTATCIGADEPFIWDETYQ